MTTSEHIRRTALARSNHLNPGHVSYRKLGEPSKKELNDMLREAVTNTATCAVDTEEEQSVS